MKKILTSLSLFLLIASSTSAQALRYGITGAMNASNYAIEQGNLSYEPESRIGFKAGFRMEIDAPFIAKGFYFDMETLLSSRGAKMEQVEESNIVSTTLRPYYLEIPIHIGYRYDFGTNLGIFASFGPYFDIGLFGTNKVFDGITESKPNSFSQDGVKRFDFGLGLRGGAQIFSHYRIYVGYDWGLLNIAKDFPGGTANNRNFYIGMAYMF
ncbi:MAG: PorT family protein [Alistipes sp.]|nr:PorT family protein [Alistipes sp.]